MIRMTASILPVTVVQSRIGRKKGSIEKDLVANRFFALMVNSDALNTNLRCPVPSGRRKFPQLWTLAPQIWFLVNICQNIGARVKMGSTKLILLQISYQMMFE